MRAAADSAEAAARTMDRILMTAETEMDGVVAFDIRLEDIEAVITEMDGGKPCGICGQARCRQRGES